QYGYKKTVKVTEFGKDGQPSGEFQMTTQLVVDPDGKMYEKVVDKQPNSLHAIELTPLNTRALGQLPSYPSITQQLSKSELPFMNFETYRENGDGKYWFPNYARSDDTLHFKESGDVPVRLVIKWSDFKPLPVAAQAAPADVAAKPKP